MNNTTKATLRMTALAAMVAMSGMMAGCTDDDDGGPGGSGGSGGGGGAGGSGDAVSFSGTNGPASAVSQALSLSSFAAQAAAVAGSIAPAAPAAAAEAKATDGPCTDGGSFTNRASSTGTNSNVPFEGASSTQFSLGGADFSNCVIAASSGSNGGITVDSKTLINGPITSGSASGLAFVSIGDSDSKTLDYIIDVKSSGTAGGQSFNATSKATLSQFYRFDIKSITGGSEQQLFSVFKFKAESKGSSGGQTGSGGATGLVRYGKSLSDRFKFVSNAEGFSMNGSYFYDLTTCSGEVTVATEEPLTVSPSGLSAGRLKLTTGGQSVTVSYDNGSVIYNEGKADQKVFTAQEAAQAASSNVCAGALGLTPAAALAYLPR